MLRGGTADRAAIDPAALASFADNLAEPARARACVQVYRTFVTREQLAADPRPLRVHPPARPHPPGARRARPRDHRRLVAGYEAHADEMTTELVPDCGHFIADERPDLVVDRARALFA